MQLNISSLISEISPDSISNGGFELQNQTLIPQNNIPGEFEFGKDIVEFYVYDINFSLLYEDYNYSKWEIKEDGNTIDLYPEKNLIDEGFTDGTYYTVYNFITSELSSSWDKQYFISDISSDRTEIRLKSNQIEDSEIENSFNEFKSKIDSAENFDEFYISFGENQYYIAVNIDTEVSSEGNSLLIKLYESLPSQFNVKDQLYIFSKPAETKSFKVVLKEQIEIEDNLDYIKGPNTNIDINDFVNNSTVAKSKEDLISTNSSESKFNLEQTLNQNLVQLSPNYSYDTFNEFVNFSSAKKRIENFIDKVDQIQNFESDIETLSALTGSTHISSSVQTLYSSIEDIIKNFDGYEYYLYYNTEYEGNYSYPKDGDKFPLTLKPLDSLEVKQWLGSDNPGSPYYGGIILSASLYDENNQNWLYYTIPEFIRENEDNSQYIDFCNMVGQHFDELWLYTKGVTKKLNTTNDLNDGVPLKLAEDTIKSLGFEGLANNFNNEEPYIGLTGEKDGEFVPSTGSELITDFISINGGKIVNYWNPEYSFLFYVQSIQDPGFPYPIDRVSKEIYKRLYHNMAYLVKKKGTISGLRQLINIWGIPDTILRINEFGGKNKNIENDYDLWYDRYSFAYKPISTQHVASSSVVFPWMPLERNRQDSNQYIVPDSFQFRFKTTGYPSSSFGGEFFTQSLAVKKSDGDNTSTNVDFGIVLHYTGSGGDSYLGANNKLYEDYGNLSFYISGSGQDGGVAESDPIYLPFFDKGWWSVMLQRDQHVSVSDNSNNTTYTLYVKNKIDNGYDGNQIGYEASSSIISNVSESINEAWNKFGTTSSDGIYLGGFVSGSSIGSTILNPQGKIFSGSFQEFRYYASPISESVFNDFVANPESIEGNSTRGKGSSFDILSFRAPLGNEMESKFITTQSGSHTQSFTSFHPSVDTSVPQFITSSFVDPNNGDITSSLYDVIYYENISFRTFSEPNVETYLLDQPAIGLRNRISNKIQSVDNRIFGDVLSNQKSLKQQYPISESFTEDTTRLEVAFSPQEEINDDIIQTFGFGVVSDAIADPRFISQSVNYYPELKETAQEYFKKYKKSNVYDYLRLIKYFDNSIFKAIKKYVPARTNVDTGIVIKQHMLERNRNHPTQITDDTIIAKGISGSKFNVPFKFENLEITSSLQIGEISGSTGGSVNQFNYNNSQSFNQLPITQSWSNDQITPLGLVSGVEDSQKEFYDGEYSGSEFFATTQSLFNNPFLDSSTTETIYNIQVENIGLQEYTDASSTFIELRVGNPTFEDIEVYVNQSMGGQFSSVVWVDKFSNGWYITGIALSPINTQGVQWESLFVDHNLGTTNNKTILPPDEEYKYSNGESRSKIPYFTFPLPTGSLYKDDESSGGLLFGQITSFGLTVDEYGGINNAGGIPTRIWKFNQEDSRPIKLEDGSPNLTPQVYDPVTPIKFLSPSDQINQSNPSNVSEGNGKVQFFGSTFYAQSDDEIEYWYPSYIRLHNKSSNNNNNNNNNNTPSFKLNPDVKFELEETGSLRNDGTGVDTNIVDTSIMNTPIVTTFNQSQQNTYVYINNSVNLIEEGNSRRTNTYVGDNPTSLVEFNPFIDPSSNIDFQNSEFFATINNFNANRKNTFAQQVDYSNGTLSPLNATSIIEGTAPKADIPDSNYTTTRIIRPRYDGVKLQSANYNFYTKPSTSVKFIDGSEGNSWSGDISYGNTAVIDSNPIYFAHFKSSQETREVFNTVTFDIDTLIKVPDINVRGKTIEPDTLKIEGNEERVYEVISTFSKDRDVTISYNNNINFGVNFGKKKSKASIIQGALEYDFILGNEIDSTSNVNTLTFNTSSWCLGLNSSGISSTVDLNTKNNIGEEYWMSTGSGYLQLDGGYYEITGSFDVSTNDKFSIQGPSLGLIHSINHAVENGRGVNESPNKIGIPKNSNITSDNQNNSFIFKPSESNLGNYEDKNIEFLIKRGDEIRITYNKTSNPFNPVLESIDFSVLDIQSSIFSSNGNYLFSTTLIPSPIDGSSIIDKILVSPDPSDFDIPNGEIYKFTVRRRNERDNKVVVFQTPPSGSQGIKTPSGGGYLIPNDLSNTQKRNVQAVINQLNSKNVFDNSDNSNLNTLN